MKILYVVNHPGEGGMENHVFLLAKYALASGHKVDFIFGGQGPLVERVRTLGCGIHFLKMRAPYDPIALIGLVRMFKKIRPDVVHTHFLRENFLAIDASKFVPVPAIFSTVHRLELKTTLQAKANAIYSKALTKFIAVSPMAKQYLVDEGIKESKIVSIYNGSEVQGRYSGGFRKKLGLAKSDYIIGNVGRYSAEKGQASLIKAFSKTKIPNAKLVLMGTGPLEDKLRAQVGRLKLSDKVVFTLVEFVDGHDNTAEFIASCDIYVQPSKIENLPTSVVEAMLLGVPVVASDCPAHKWLLKNGERGTLYKNGSDVALAESLDTISLDRSKGSRLAKAAREYATLHLTAQRMWDSTELIYKKYASINKDMLR